MARTAPKNVVEDTEVEATEATEQDTNGEVVAEDGTVTESDDTDEQDDTETDEQEPTEAPAEPEIDLTGFEAATGQVINTSHPQDGTLDQASVDAAIEVYLGLPGAKPKKAARDYLGNLMREYMMSPDGKLREARAAMVFLKEIEAAKSNASAAPKVQTDPTQDFIDKVVTARLVYSILIGSVPDGVASDWDTKSEAKLVAVVGQLDTYRSYLEQVAATPEDGDEPDEPEVDETVRQAFRQARSTKSKKAKGGSGTRVVTYTGARRSIIKHIEEAFANQPVGTFLKVSEISSAKSSEYGDDTPSQGAVSSQIKSWAKSGKRPIPGLEPATIGGLFGASKTA
jgi:hypothetical protein